MKVIRVAAVVLGALVSNAGAFGAAPSHDLKRDGAFAFPQSGAEVLCDQKDLRLSVWNDVRYLYVQAVVWADSDDSLGETNDGRPIGDTSSLCLDVDSDRKATPHIDRDYSLNPWPRMPGLHYQVALGESSWTHLKSDSRGHGAIRYVDVGKGRRVRVDSMAIPLAEIGKKPGDKLCLAYWASSPKPALTLNSIGYQRQGKYYAFSLPRKIYHEITLKDRAASLDLSQVPEGRQDQIPLGSKALKPSPEVGSVPPEVSAKDWINTAKAPTLASLKGQLVLVEFWATWCGPCVQGIPHLNKLQDEYGSKGLTILSFTDQSRQGIENFLKQTPITYVIGTGSDLASAYGVTGIPHAFLIGKDGKLLWEGSPNAKDFDQRIRAALSLGPQERPQERLIGQWSNIDPRTRGLTRMVIDKKGDAWSIETWGKAHPQDSQSGKATLHLLGANVGARDLNFGFASWDFQFKVEHLTIYLDSDKLVVESYNIFKDGSGRSNYRSRYEFVRAR